MPHLTRKLYKPSAEHRLSTPLVDTSPDVFVDTLSAYETGLTAQELKTEYMRHVADNYFLKLELQRSLRLALTLLKDENVNAPLKVKIALKLVEGIQACTAGFHTRVIESSMLLKVPETLDDLLYNIRHGLVERAVIETLHLADPGNQVHQRNQFFNLAEEPYGVLAINRLDPFRGDMSNQETLAALATIFTKQYQLFGVLHGLQKQCEIVFDYQGHKTPETGGYVLRNYQPLVDLFNKIITNKPSGSFQPDDLCIFDDDSICIDINWSTINKLLYNELKKQGYFTVSHDEDRLILQLLNDEQALNNENRAVFLHIITDLNQLVQCLLFFRHYSNSRKAALVGQYMSTAYIFNGYMVQQQCKQNAQDAIAMMEQLPEMVYVLEELIPFNIMRFDESLFLNRDATQKTLLMRAVSRGNMEIMDFLLTQLKTLPKTDIVGILKQLMIEGQDRKNILMMAVCSKNAGVVELILNVIQTLDVASQRSILEQTNLAGSHVWRWAISCGQIDIIQSLYEIMQERLNEITFRNMLMHVNEYGKNALMSACEQNLTILHILYYFLTPDEQKIQLQQISQDGSFALMNALKNQSVDVAQFILSEMLRYDLHKAVQDHFTTLVMSANTIIFVSRLIAAVQSLPVGEKKIELLAYIFNHFDLIKETDSTLSCFKVFESLDQSEKIALIQACFQTRIEDKEKLIVAQQFMIVFNDAELSSELPVRLDYDFFLTRDATNLTPILAAIEQGKSGTLKWYLTHLARLSVAEKKDILSQMSPVGSTILMCAAQNQPEVVPLILTLMQDVFTPMELKLNLLQINQSHNNALMYAAQKSEEGLSAILQMIKLQSEETQSRLFMQTNENGENALFMLFMGMNDKPRSVNLLVEAMFSSSRMNDEVFMRALVKLADYKPEKLLLLVKTFLQQGDLDHAHKLLITPFRSRIVCPREEWTGQEYDETTVTSLLHAIRSLDDNEQKTVLIQKVFEAVCVPPAFSRFQFFSEMPEARVSDEKAFFTHTDDEGRNVLMIAIINNDTEVVDIVLEKMKYLDIETRQAILMATDKSGHNALTRAIIKNRYVQCVFCALSDIMTNEQLCFIALNTTEEGVFHLVHSRIDHDVDQVLSKALLFNRHVPFSLVEFYLDNDGTSNETLMHLFDSQQAHLQAHLRTYFYANATRICSIYERINSFDADMDILKFIFAMPNLNSSQRIELINHISIGPDELTCIANHIGQSANMALDEIIAVSKKTSNHHDLECLFRAYIEAHQPIDSLLTGLQQAFPEPQDRKKRLFETLHMKAYEFVIKSIQHPDKKSQYDEAADAILTLYEALNRAENAHEVQRAIQLHRTVLDKHRGVKKILCDIVDFIGNLFGVTHLAAASHFSLFKTKSSIILDEISDEYTLHNIGM